MNKIDRRRFPDIECNGQTYSYNGTETPLEQVLEVMGNKSIFLVGNGGQGKSTTLFSYWLDHISNENCLYVDLRLLNSTEGEDAIENYIYMRYHIKLSVCYANYIILLDGVNEAPLGLRETYKNQEPQFLTEMKDFLGFGCRIVLSSRADDIGLIEESKIFDLDEEKISFCELHSLRVEQVQDVCPEEIHRYDDAVTHLLQNNAMLSMYQGLNSVLGVEVFNNQNEICAGMLLVKYFDVYMRLKYIKKFISGEYGGYSYKDIYEELNDSKTKRSNEWIQLANSSWNKFNKVLVKSAFSNQITEEDVNKFGTSALELGILRISAEFNGRKKVYCFADELYQTYYLIKKFSTIIDVKDKEKSIVIAPAAGGFVYFPENFLN